MEIGKVIWSVFAFLGMAIVAVLLYDLLFAYDYTASSSAQGDGNDHLGTHAISETLGVQKGAIWALADGIQSGMSLYTYNYCYLPVIHETDEIDAQLSLTIRGQLVDSIGNTITNPDDTPVHLDNPSEQLVESYESIWSGGFDWYEGDWT